MPTLSLPQTRHRRSAPGLLRSTFLQGGRQDYDVSAPIPAARDRGKLIVLQNSMTTINFVKGHEALSTTKTNRVQIFFRSFLPIQWCAIWEWKALINQKKRRKSRVSGRNLPAGSWKKKRRRNRLCTSSLFSHQLHLFVCEEPDKNPAAALHRRSNLHAGERCFFDANL